VKVLHYEAFACTKRLALVKECANTIHEGLHVLYILPSREAMFHVRRLFTKELGGIFGCHIIGFADLEKQLMKDDYNGNTVIRDLEKQILLQQVLLKIPQATIFDKVKEKPGFIKLLIHTIRQIKRLNVLPPEFLSKTAFLKGDILKKCQGLHAIYICYEEMKAEKGLMDIDDISLQAVDACKNTKLFENVGRIVIDGFINIDPVNVNLLKNIIKQYPEIDICANVPYRNPNNEQFLRNEVLKDWDKLGFNKVTSADVTTNQDHSQLTVIANRLYSGAGNIKINMDMLKISNSPCMDHEIRAAAGEIKALIQKQSIKPSDIAVITADVTSYRSKVHEVFREYGIPLQIKENFPLSSIPVIKDIVGMWKLGMPNEKQSAILSLITSKYLLPEVVLVCENFETSRLFKMAEIVFKTGQGDDFGGAFMNRYAEDNENEAAIEAMGAYVTIVTNFENMLMAEPSNALNGFKVLMDGLHIEKNISALYREGVLTGELWLRNVGALKEFFSLVDRIVVAYIKYGAHSAHLEHEVIIKDMLDLLVGLEIGDVSRDSGGVRLIAPDLAKGQDYDAVFLLGVNEGAFPALGDSILFNNDEVKALFDLGINLGFQDWELEREKLRFNSCIAAARNKLYLSYRTADEDGSIMIPSPFVDEIKAVLDKGRTEGVVLKPISMRDRMSCDSEAYSLSEAVKQTSARLKSKDGLAHEGVNHQVRKKLDYLPHVASVEFSREYGREFDIYDGKLNNHILVQENANYGFSASQLNHYSRCPFTYFAEKVLGIAVENKSMRERMDTGIFYHAVLKVYYEDNENYLEPDSNRLIDIFNNILVEMAADMTFDSVPAYLKRFIKEELLMVLQDFIVYDAKNMSRYYETTGCHLKPVLLEEPFKTTLKKEGYGILSGVADRIDLEIDNNGKYTGRFILYDYKKGKINGIKQCIEGNDFQLSLYYIAFNKIIQEKFKIAKAECIALLYYSIENLDRNGIIRKDIKKALFEGTKGTKSTPDKANMEVVLSWVEEESMMVINNIRKGIFMPLKQCPAVGNYDCLYKGMCRYDRMRLSQKVGITG